MKTITVLLVSSLIAVAGVGSKDAKDLKKQAVSLLENNSGTENPKNDPAVQKRILGEEIKKMEAQIDSDLPKIIASFESASRLSDPFATSMRQPLRSWRGSTEGALLVETEANTQDDTTSLFSRSVATIKIGGVHTTKKEILVGSDNLYVGDEFDMEFGGMIVTVTFHDLTEDAAVFQDKTSGKFAEVPLPISRKPKIIRGMGIRAK